MLTALTAWNNRNKVRSRLLIRRLRGSQFALILLAGFAGLAVGAIAYLMHLLVRLIHHHLFTIPLESYLSDPIAIPHWRILTMPVAGGLLVGVISWGVRKWRGHEVIDAVEANALYGGRMSLLDSCGLALVTIISVGSGASVGMEAAYTQLGSAVFSRIGQLFKARRNDLRTLVGCGAAAAIAAAFNAPLAGAFYAFELVIGSYSPAVLLPVAVAAATSALVTQTLALDAPAFPFIGTGSLSGAIYLLFPVIGFLSGLVGIVVMQGASAVEARLRLALVPLWLRPMLGGAVVALLASFLPQVLGSGHGAINTMMAYGFAPATLFALIAAKLIASSISIGSGFRGGLFSASLMIGSLFGGACAYLLALAFPDLDIYRNTLVLVGMASVAATVVGGPLTMVFLVLEGTGDFSTTIAVIVSVIFASAVGQHLFGYSFATWRFHLRGINLKGAHDIGWLRELTVDRIMRRDPRVVDPGFALGRIAEEFPLGTGGSVFVVDETGYYRGSADVAKVHELLATGTDASAPIGTLIRGEPHLLLPGTSVRAAIDIFAASAQEELAVVDSGKDRRVVGYLSEAAALRRYSQELERRRAEEQGTSAIFAPDSNPR
jgi:CIC family chloride channel protein